MDRVWVAGIDGCRSGWIAVCMALPAPVEPQICLYRQFDDLLTACPPLAVLAIDIPIGLLDTPQPGGRLCDRLARRLLGRRASSVFSPPARSCLEATHYAQVRTQGVSRQAFGILPKIREVDRFMTPELQARVYEAHPELAFRTLTGAPIPDNKKTRTGHQARLHALERLQEPPFGDLARTFTQTCTTFKRTDVAPDDLLDAYVLAWTARRIATGQAERLPPSPPVDRRGLRMEIWY